MRYKRLPWLVYCVLVLAILGSLVKPGYIFALDMVFGPRIHLPISSQSNYPFYVFLKILNFAIPAQIIEKLILFTVLFLSGIGTHRLVDSLLSDKNKNQLVLYFSGLFYMINPFTYARFMDGQFAVLLGYALMPFFIKTLFDFVKNQDLHNTLKLAALAFVIFVISIHTAGLLIIVVAVSCTQFVWFNRHNHTKLKRFAAYGLAAIGIILVASSFWLVPILRGSSPTTTLIDKFDDRHLLTFRTSGKSDLAVVSNVLGLQGYWGEREGSFKTIASTVPWWPVIALGIIALSVYGAVKNWQDKRVRVIVISAAFALVFAIGIAADPFKQLNEWLIRHIFFFKAYREPQKFVGLLALAYAALAGLGLNQLAKLKIHNIGQKLVPVFLILPVVFTPTMLWGFAGQLKAADYPEDWYIANQTIIAEARGSTLFLPWHQYMYFDFAGRVIANPAPRFFDGKVIAGDNVEIGLIKHQIISPETQIIEPLLNERENLQLFGTKIRKLNVEYIVLSKTADWEDYSFLDKQTDLKPLMDTNNIKVYRNLAFTSGDR